MRQPLVATQGQTAAAHQPAASAGAGQAGH